jgi:hypothetical protein
MESITSVVQSIAAVTCLLYLLVPQDQLVQYFAPQSRTLFILNNVAFFAIIVLIVRSLVGYDSNSVNQLLLTVGYGCLSLYNIGSFIHLKRLKAAQLKQSVTLSENDQRVV